MRFGPFLVFAALWSVLVYAVLAHWAFGGGWLQHGGTLDFAGGVPVEMGSGFSALAAAIVVGARRDYGRQAFLPHNVVFVLLGAGLLWFGWFGFNGGSAYSAGDAGVLAFVNTLLTPACTLATWFVLDLIRGRQVTAIGAATAIIVGCVGITPAAGYIAPGWAMLLGVVAALPSYAVIVWRTRTRVDETLDVLAAHGLAGFTGILFIGFFAQSGWNGVADGLLYGNAAQLGHQALAAVAAPAYAFCATFALLKLIGLVTPLRASRARKPSAWTSSPTARRPTPPARARSSSSSPTTSGCWPTAWSSRRRWGSGVALRSGRLVARAWSALPGREARAPDFVTWRRP